VRRRVAAPSSHPSVCTTDSSSASALPLQGNGVQPTSPQLSALETVFRYLLVLILHRLSVHNKLTVISRLSRAFRPLPALAFSHDPIDELLRGFTW
jgi:hypothetical protein